MNSKKIAIGGIFAAIIVVLQVISNFVKFGPVNITLALAPIIIGAALYGRRFSAFLGAVLGLVVALCGLFGLDGGFVLSLATYHPIIIYLVAFLKTTVAGYIAGIVYELISKKQPFTAVIVSGIVCPLVNTGLFVAAMLIFFKTALLEMAAGTHVVSFIVFTLTGVNFAVELAVNMILATAITRVIKVLKKTSKI